MKITGICDISPDLKDISLIELHEEGKKPNRNPIMKKRFV
jgi:hypothetical protein